MRTKFFLSKVVFLQLNSFIKRKQIYIKKGLGNSQKENEIFVSVATLAMLAILSKRQADKIFIFANGYSFAVIAIK